MGDLESFMIHQHRKRYGAMPVLNRRRDYIYYTNSPEREAKGKKNFTRHGTVRRAVVKGKRGIHKQLPRRLDFSRSPFPMQGGPQAAVLDQMDLDAHEPKLCGEKRSTNFRPYHGKAGRSSPELFDAPTAGTTAVSFHTKPCGPHLCKTGNHRNGAKAV